MREPADFPGRIGTRALDARDACVPLCRRGGPVPASLATLPGYLQCLTLPLDLLVVSAVGPRRARGHGRAARGDPTRRGGQHAHVRARLGERSVRRGARPGRGQLGRPGDGRRRDPARRPTPRRWRLVALGHGRRQRAGGHGRGRAGVPRGRGQATLYAETGAVVVTSLARGEDGTVYAGTIPEGGSSACARRRTATPGARPVGAAPEHRDTCGPSRGTAGATFARGHGSGGRALRGRAQRHGDGRVRQRGAALYSLALGRTDDLHGRGRRSRGVYAVRAPARPARWRGSRATRSRASPSTANAHRGRGNEFTEPPEPPLANTVSSTARAVAGRDAARARAPVAGACTAWAQRDVPSGCTTTPDAHVTALEVDRERGGEVPAALGADGGRRDRARPNGQLASSAIDVDEAPGARAVGHRAARACSARATRARLHLVVSARPASACGPAACSTAHGVRAGAPCGGAGTARRLGSAQRKQRPPDSTWHSWGGPRPTASCRRRSARYLQIRARWNRDPNSVMRAVTAYYLRRTSGRCHGSTARSQDGRPAQAVHIGWKVENPDRDGLRNGCGSAASPTLVGQTLRHGEYLTATSYDWADGGPARGLLPRPGRGVGRSRESRGRGQARHPGERAGAGGQHPAARERATAAGWSRRAAKWSTARAP